jgi:hypothetical protein
LTSLDNDVLCSYITDLVNYPTLISFSNLCQLFKVQGSTLTNFLTATGVHREKFVMKNSVNHGPIEIASPFIRYYDPLKVARALRRELHSREGVGDRLWSLPSTEGVVRFLPKKHNSGFCRGNVPIWVRWTMEQVEERVQMAEGLGLWLTTREVAEWLDVSTMTLYRWRRVGVGPPFLRRANLVPSSARDPRTGTVKPSGLHHLRGRHLPVLYDRNQVVGWLKKTRRGG